MFSDSFTFEFHRFIGRERSRAVPFPQRQIHYLDLCWHQTGKMFLNSFAWLLCAAFCKRFYSTHAICPLFLVNHPHEGLQGVTSGREIRSFLNDVRSQVSLDFQPKTFQRDLIFRKVRNILFEDSDSKNLIKNIDSEATFPNKWSTTVLFLLKCWRRPVVSINPFKPFRKKNIWTVCNRGISNCKQSFFFFFNCKLSNQVGRVWKWGKTER